LELDSLDTKLLRKGTTLLEKGVLELVGEWNIMWVSGWPENPLGLPSTGVKVTWIGWTQQRRGLLT